MSNSKNAVSKAQNEEHKRVLTALLKLEENRRCADCQARGPTWASVNLGVFICLNCSGIHRRVSRQANLCLFDARRLSRKSWRADQLSSPVQQMCAALSANLGLARALLLSSCGSVPPAPTPAGDVLTPLALLRRRSMGVHLSKVRSANLDTWLPEQVRFVAAMGNGRAAVFWEARLPHGFERPRDGDMRALSVFINQKYVSVFCRP